MFIKTVKEGDSFQLNDNGRTVADLTVRRRKGQIQLVFDTACRVIENKTQNEVTDGQRKR